MIHPDAIKNSKTGKVLFM